jgi:serine/threonine protein kinase
MTVPANWLSDRTLSHLRQVADWPDLSATKYELLEVLGQGGMATVYLGRDRDLDRQVAIKVVRLAEGGADLVERLRQEARILARLEHPGLVPVHDLGALPDGRVFYVMKRVRGQRLDERLREVPSLAARLRLFERICETVSFAHAHGVIHRDLKPENVMVGPFGEVLVLDWGVAKLRGEGGPAGPRTAFLAEAAATAHGIVVGTPGFMSPEQALGQPVDGRADVFALGRILEALLAEPGTPIPRPLASIARKALAAEPDRRYSGARELGEDVGRYLSGLRVLAHRESTLEVLGRLATKYKTPLALILAYVLMRAALLFFRGR